MYGEQKYESATQLTGKAIEKSGIEMAMERLAIQIDSASTNTSILRERLRPVLRPVGSGSVKACEGVPTPIRCPLEDSINELADRVQRMGADLLDMRETLCV